MFYLTNPRYLQKFYKLKTLILNTNFFPWNNCRRVVFLNMDRIEKILKADKDIEKKIMALRCEVSDVEVKILDNFLIERLERENKELEEEIQKYREELIQLEKINGRFQVLECTTQPAQNVSIEADASTKKLQEAVPKSPQTKENAQNKEIKETKKIEKGASKQTDKPEAKKAGSEELPVDIGRLDMKVGRICDIQKHPDADSLYVEKVDIGKPDQITVVSGLVKHIPADDLKDSLVIILCNLKPAKMRGITSEGMVMCANNEGVVEVLRPPSDSEPGDVVSCPGYNSNPDPVMNPKKKIFETVAPDLKTDGECVATYKGARWTVGNKGFVKAQTLKEANIK